MIGAAVALGVGLLRGGVRNEGLSLAASSAAVLLIVVGVVRSSGRRD